MFGEIVNQEMVLNAAGRMLKKWYTELENKFQDIRCNEYIIMPNHSHVIITNLGKAPVGGQTCVSARMATCRDVHRANTQVRPYTGSFNGLRR